METFFLRGSGGCIAELELDMFGPAFTPRAEARAEGCAPEPGLDPGPPGKAGVATGADARGASPRAGDAAAGQRQAQPDALLPGAGLHGEARSHAVHVQATSAPAPAVPTMPPLADAARHGPPPAVPHAPPTSALLARARTEPVGPPEAPVPAPPLPGTGDPRPGAPRPAPPLPAPEAEAPGDAGHSAEKRRCERKVVVNRPNGSTY